MAAGVFVGRPRPRWRILLWGILTLGVYGRVWLYKTARDIDGHETRFLDLRLYKAGVILPIVGPFIVKWRLTTIVRDLVGHDPTAGRVRVGWLRLAALLPLVPLVHVLLQGHITPHWNLHRKLDNLSALREVIDSKRKGARSPAAQAEIAELEAQVKEQEAMLEDAREAAIAIREAKLARQRAREEVRAAGGSRFSGFSPLGFLGRWRRRPPTEIPAPTSDTGLPPEPEPPRRLKLRRTEPESTRPPPLEPPAPIEPVELSRQERKALAKAEKAERKEAERALKERVKAEKQAAKDAERAAKIGAPEAAPSDDDDASAAAPAGRRWFGLGRRAQPEVAATPPEPVAAAPEPLPDEPASTEVPVTSPPKRRRR